MTSIVPISTFFKNHNGLNVCIPNGEPIKVIQWQSSSDLKYNNTDGVYDKSPNFQNKAREYIKTAYLNKCDLLLTPEYSFPYSVLEEIIMGNLYLPDKGQLWALCMQGENKNDFLERIKRWNCLSNTRVVDLAFETTSSKSFVAPLIYIFLDNENNICIIPQFKTHPMADARNKFEAPNLCTGSIVFEFDLTGEQVSQNRFISIICSDVHNIKSDEIISNTTGSKLVVFHPQLNQDPRYDTFTAFRKGFFEYSNNKEVKVITLNWSAETMIDKEKFQIPYSAYYKKGNSSELINMIDNIYWNHSKGTYLTFCNHTEIWFSTREEHCKVYLISKGDNGGVAWAAAHRDDPTTVNYFKFENSTWKVARVKDDLLKFVKNNQGEDYTFPMDLFSRDVFFGICFGHMFDGEIKASKDELSTRMIVGSDYHSDNTRHNKAGDFNDLVKLLQRGRFPAPLSYLINNHEFRIDKKLAKNNIIAGNLYPKMKPSGEDINPFDGVLVVISNKRNEKEIRQLLKEITKKIHTNTKERVLIYYRPSNSFEFECFSEHLEQKNIGKAEFSSSITSFKRGIR